MRTDKAATSSEPEKGLTEILKKNAGRDSTGKISVRHRGGRQKRYYRKVDFKRDKRDIKAEVISIEYDPNRSANIALVKYKDGEKRYILHPQNLEVGNKIVASNEAEVEVGNALKLVNIPLGTPIHNIELYPTKGGQIVRGAGSYATIVAKGKKYADVKLPSKEIRKIPLSSYATIGQISNPGHKFEKIGKAGRKRHMGVRPTVRGVVQHPASHPHGGGEGRAGEGRHPKTPWGKPARGKKTRKKKKWSDKLIVKRRK